MIERKFLKLIIASAKRVLFYPLNKTPSGETHAWATLTFSRLLKHPVFQFTLFP